jgi:hypothetical protein
MEDKLDTIAVAISKQLEGVESRLTEHVSKQIAGQAGEIANLSAQVSGFEARVTTAVAELKHQGRLNLEELKTEVKLAAEGYGANLDRIERELVALNKKMDMKFTDHHLILANHNTRITTLEQR